MSISTNFILDSLFVYVYWYIMGIYIKQWKIKKKVIGSHKWFFWIKSIKSVPNRNRDHTIDALFCLNNYLISELENRKRVPILWYLITHFLMHVAFSLFFVGLEVHVWVCCWSMCILIWACNSHWYDTFWFKLSSDAVAACKRNFAVLFLRWILSITALLMA